MSLINAPIGLRPAWHPSGCIRQEQIANIDQTASFLQFQPVGIDIAGADGQLVPVAPALISAAPNDFIGVFMGVEYTGTDGRRRVQNKWDANTPILANTELVAYYTRDPNIVYEMQANSAIANTAIGLQYTYTQPTPGTSEAVTGLFRGALDTTSGAASGTQQGALKVIGLNPGPNNVFGSGFPDLQVIINAHQDRPGRTDAGVPA